MKAQLAKYRFLTDVSLSNITREIQSLTMENWLLHSFFQGIYKERISFIAVLERVDSNYKTSKKPRKIELLGLPVRVHNALMRADFTEISELRWLVQTHGDDLHKVVRNLGLSGGQHIIRKLKEYDEVQ